jgi:hypothetical protein
LPFDDFRTRFGSLEAAPEAALLAEINRGFSEAFWEQYSALRRRSESGHLSETEREDLMRLIQRREAANVERLKYVVELARRPNTTPRDLWQRLGLGPE